MAPSQDMQVDEQPPQASSKSLARSHDDGGSDKEEIVKPPKKKQRVVEPASDSDGDQKLVKTKKDAQNGTAKVNGKVDAETNGNVKGDGKKPVASIFGQKSVKSTSQSATSSASASGKASTSKVKELDDDQENDADNAKTKASDSESTSTETEDSESDSELDGDIAADIADKVVTKKAKKPVTKEPINLGKAPEWKKGEPVPYAALVHMFRQVESTTKRIQIASYLTAFLIKVIENTPGDLLKVIYLCINRLCPDYEGLELGIGESLLIKGISAATGRKDSQIKTELKEEGDLGLVAQKSKGKQPGLNFSKPKPLTVEGTYKILKAIAQVKGNGSQGQKVGHVNKLLTASQGPEAKFLVRSLEGKLRIGLAERSVLVALAHAVYTTRTAKTADAKKLSKEQTAEALEQAADVVKAVFSELPNYDLIIPALLEHGTEGLAEHCKLTPGIPLKPMLAKPTKAISEVLNRFEGKRFTCEYKYDGERAQVHYMPDGGGLRVFSRNSEDMSSKYPDLVLQMERCINKETTQSFVLDAEAVAWDVAEKRMLPFQDLSRRKRKDVRLEEITVRVHIFAFDLLFLNGESLLHKDLSERRDLLRSHFNPVEGEFSFAKWSDADNPEEIQIFLDESVKDGCEGLMVKMLEGKEAYYEPSRRSINWLKVKKDYLEGTGDSFDLAVIGGYYGRGKRTQWYGAYLLACYDADSEKYQAICKIGTGFSEEQLAKFHNELKPLEIATKKTYYDVGDAKPDIFFEPKYVWEILAADISTSPIYPAAKGLIDGERGASLRFPRLVRVRDDKKPDNATDAEQVAEAYNRQSHVTAAKGSKKSNGKADEYW